MRTRTNSVRRAIILDALPIKPMATARPRPGLPLGKRLTARHVTVHTRNAALMLGENVINVVANALQYAAQLIFEACDARTANAREERGATEGRKEVSEREEEAEREHKRAKLGKT